MPVVSAGTPVVIVVVWDTGEESGIFIEKFNGDRGEDIVDFVPIDKSIGEDGGDGGGWFSCDLVMVRSTGVSEGGDVSLHVLLGCGSWVILWGIRGVSSLNGLRWSVLILGNILPFSALKSALLSCRWTISYGPNQLRSS